MWGPDGIAIFDVLHRRGTVCEAMLYAFDLLELDEIPQNAPPSLESGAKADYRSSPPTRAMSKESYR